MGDRRYKELKRSIQESDPYEVFIQKLDRAMKDGFGINQRNKSEPPILFVAARYSRLDIVKELLRRGAEVNCESNYRHDDMTILTYLLSTNNVSESVIQQILDLVSEELRFNKVYRGKSLLDWVINPNYLNTADLLLSKYKDRFSNEKKIKALFTAVSVGYRRIAEELLKQLKDGIKAQDSQGNTLLHTTNYPKMAALLLNHGADVNAHNTQGITPIQNAAAKGDEKTFNYLKEHGADLFTVDSLGGTVLTSAITGGNLNIINTLLEAGVDPNAGIWEKKTAIYYAISSSHYSTKSEQLEVIKRLVDAGAELNIIDGKKRTPLMQALIRQESDLVRLLLELGADVNYKAPNERTALSYLFSLPCPAVFLEETLKLFMEYNVDINVTGKNGESLINMFLTGRSYPSGSLEILKLLIDKGVDVNCTSPEPPLICALRYNASLSVIKTLLEAGADPDAANERNEFPLFIAVNVPEEYGAETEIIRTILDYTKDVNQRGPNGKTALGILCQRYVDTMGEFYGPFYLGPTYKDFLEAKAEKILMRIQMFIQAGATLKADTKWCKPLKLRSKGKKVAYDELMAKITQFENTITQLKCDTQDVWFDYEL